MCTKTKVITVITTKLTVISVLSSKIATNFGKYKNEGHYSNDHDIYIIFGIGNYGNFLETDGNSGNDIQNQC